MKTKSILKPYMQPAFLVCVAVLAAAGSGMSTIKSYMGMKLIKLPLPLQNSFDMMDENKLAPYKVLSKHKIDNADVLEALGTEEYIQWVLEDTEVSRSSGARYCHLFITYYTGTPDRVPHIPEECYLGGGNQRFARERVVFEVSLPKNTVTGINADFSQFSDQTIPATHVVLGSKAAEVWETESRFSIFYFFKVNGVYRVNRNATRLELMSNITGKYSYFSKVEWKFLSNTVGQNINLEKDEAIGASRKLLSVVLPILEMDHWPDWNKAINEEGLDNQN